MLESKALLIILIGYMLGCLSTGYYLVRLRTGKDIRQHGSGNIGARNVGRVLGAPGFALAFLGDFAKGALAAWLALTYNLSPWAVILTLIAVVLGHIWPITLRFRGGKGIATAFGAVLVFDPYLILILAGLFGLILAGMRQFTLSGLIAVAAAPLAVIILKRSQPEIIGITILALLILLAHRQNIRAIVHSIKPPGNP